MSRPFRLACVQVNAGNDMAANMKAAAGGAHEAAKAGAHLIAFPECVAMMEMGRRNVLAKAAPEDSHPALAGFRELARDTGAWLLVGSLTVALDGERVANRSFLLDPEGAVRARYDKIHMFDVDLSGGESYRESRTFRPGELAVVADLPWGRLGLSICYDLRFPALYRALAEGGASFFAIPSAFTRQTGEAHWHVLLRARAIENGCFVFAAAQGGRHENGRETYGHSLVVDPWGRVLAEGGTEPGVVVADVDPVEVTTARARIPSLQHGRRFELVAPIKEKEQVRMQVVGGST